MLVLVVVWFVVWSRFGDDAGLKGGCGVAEAKGKRFYIVLDLGRHVIDALAEETAEQLSCGRQSAFALFSKMATANQRLLVYIGRLSP